MPRDCSILYSPHFNGTVGDPIGETYAELADQTNFCGPCGTESPVQTDVVCATNSTTGSVK